MKKQSLRSVKDSAKHAEDLGRKLQEHGDESLWDYRKRRFYEGLKILESTMEAKHKKYLEESISEGGFVKNHLANEVAFVLLAWAGGEVKDEHLNLPAQVCDAIIDNARCHECRNCGYPFTPEGWDICPICGQPCKWF